MDIRSILGFNELSNKEIIKLSSSIEYYRNIYKEKIIKKVFKEDKNNLIES